MISTDDAAKRAKPHFDVSGFSDDYQPFIHDIEFIKQLFEAFYTDASRLLARIQVDIANSNSEKYFDDVHALKGIAGHIKAAKLLQLATEVENQLGEEFNPENARMTLLAIETCFQYTREEMETYLGTRQNS